METEIPTLIAAKATATVIIEPENLSRIDDLPLQVSYGSGIPPETKQADGSVFQYSPIARSREAAV
jgi:hypothetical protein